MNSIACQDPAPPPNRGQGPAVRRRIVCLALGLAVAAAAHAQDQTDPTLPPVSTLKKLSVEELMDIDVTSVSKRTEKISDTASAIQVITSDDIQEAGATSIPDALRLASNLEVAQIDSRQWAITARGFNNVFADKMLVLIDGRTVYTPLYAGVYWDVQDTMMEDLDRIEVISGPGGTQWGSNAMNGVINITTKSAQDTQGGMLVVGAGTELRDSVEGRYGGEIAPGVYYRVYAKDFERNPSVDPDGDDADDAWRMGQGGFRMDWDAAGGNQVTVQGDIYSGSETEAGTQDTQMSGGNILGRWSRTFANDSDVKVQVYYDHTYRSIPGSFTQTLDTYDFDFQHHLRMGGANDIVWGFGYRTVDDDILNTPANAFLPPDLVQETPSAFAPDEIAFLDGHLHLTVGSKVEHNGYTGVEVEPSVRLAWTPAKAETVWAAVSRAVRTPSRIDRDLFSPAAPPYRIAGGPEVVSETLIAYELGYRVQVAAPLAVSLATYYNDYDDLRSLDPLNPPAAFPVMISSGLRGSSDGAELTADWRIDPGWRLRLGYTEMRVRSEPQPGTLDRSGNRSIAYDPNHQAQLRSIWDLTPTWDFEAALRYVSQISNQEVPAYTELNLQTSWRPNAAWEFSLVGENLLHSEHPEFNAPGARREIPRSIFGKTSWRF
jgi:iron complex outermembrane recepter protein